MDIFNYDFHKVSSLIQDIKLPKMFCVEQKFDSQNIKKDEIEKVINKEFIDKQVGKRIKPDMKIAITASSRGIANADIILKSIVNYVKKMGGKPFIVPAMGSHGGATAEGQLEILRKYGITEDRMGCPILSSMETIKIGTSSNGKDVYIDKYIANADGIIVNCRVKPHTAFRGKYESGIMKMLTIGIGKQKGANICHSDGFGHMAENIFDIGSFVLDNEPVLFAVASVENAYGETSSINIVPSENIINDEPKILKEAFSKMPKILVDKCDVLIVDEIGKNFSGDGMDPNITGTFATPYAYGGIQAQRVAVLGISKYSEGNGMGIGYADATTVRTLNKFDLTQMYINAITSTTIQGVTIPIAMEDDKKAIQVCLKTCENIDINQPKIVRILNTENLKSIWLSEAYLNIIKSKKNLVIKSNLKEIEFDKYGKIL